MESAYKKVARFWSSTSSYTAMIRPKMNAKENEKGIPEPGKHISFSHHYYETADPEEIEVLKRRSNKASGGTKVRFLGEVYRCDQRSCSFEAKDLDTIQKHIREAHGIGAEVDKEEPKSGEESSAYVCPEPGCGASFETKQQLNGHMLKHRNEQKKEAVGAGTEPEF